MRLKQEFPTVLLPVETVARELDGHIILASVLAAARCRVVIGHKEACEHIASHSMQIVWLGKDAFSPKLPPESSAHLADRLRDNESALIFVQEEGGIFPRHEWVDLVLDKHRAEHIRLRGLDRVCVWGEKQKALLSERGIAPENNIAVTGCPRLDLCLPRYHWLQDLGVPVSRVGTRPHILMCTRFTSVAHFNGLANFFEPLKSLRPGQRLDTRLATWRRDTHDLADFVFLAHKLASHYPELDIILRPHTSEDLHFYENVFASCSTVTVTRAGSALDWIRGAELVVHCNCTTGVEAVLASKRVLNFLPNAISRENLDKEVASEAGLTATSVVDAIDKVGALLSQTVKVNIWSDNARSVLNNLNSEAIPLLAEQILSVIEARRISRSRMTLPPKNAMQRAKMRFLGHPDKSRMNSDAYVAAKRGAFSREHVENILGGCRIRNIGSGEIREFLPNYFVIDP